jgi:hypothetical protein
MNIPVRCTSKIPGLSKLLQIPIAIGIAVLPLVPGCLKVSPFQKVKPFL